MGSFSKNLAVALAIMRCACAHHLVLGSSRASHLEQHSMDMLIFSTGSPSLRTR